MQIIANQLYHIYNQGNNQETIFKTRDDYIDFLQKTRVLVSPHCQIVNYCLMPNHFHFLINSTDKSAEIVMLGNIISSQLGNGFRRLCSTYANDFNKRNKRSGSLFRQKTQAKNLEIKAKNNYPFICFHYIHQNPMRAKLCQKMEDWEFSSFRDYIGVRNGKLIEKPLAFELIGVSSDNFYEESYKVIDDDKIGGLYL